MSRDARIELDWADGHYVFRLGIGQLEELQEKCDAGFGWIATRLSQRRWFVQDIVHTIRLALIGGGTPPDTARILVQRYVEARPLNESIPIAIKILQAVLEGAGDEQPGEADAAPETESA